MARPAEGWKLHPRGKIQWVRFTHGHTRYDESTGERDPVEASARAAEIYAAVIAGRRAKSSGPVLFARQPLDELVAGWLESLMTTHGAGTIGMHELHWRAHLLPHFERLSNVTTRTIADYARKRLGEVLRKTVRKERATLRAFLEWLVEQGTIDAMPDFPALPKGAAGTRQVTRVTVDVTDEQVAAFLAALPEWSDGRKGGAGRFRVRDRFVVAWETGLRPATVDRLEVPRHFRRGGRELAVTADIDKVKYERPLPLTPAARAALERSLPEKPGPIFGEHDARAYVEAARKAARLPEGFSPYDLRHGRATHIVERTGDLLGAAYLLGHKQVSTTNRYLHPTRRAGDRVLAALAAPGAAPGFRDNSGTASAADPQKPTRSEAFSAPDPVGASGFEPPTPRPPAERTSRKAARSRPRRPQVSAKIWASPDGSETVSQNALAELRGLARCLAGPTEFAALELLEAEELLVVGGGS